MLISSRPLFLVTLLFVASTTSAEEPLPANEMPPPSGITDESKNSDESIPANTEEAKIEEEPFIDRSRGYLGKHYVDLTQTIDSFLTGKRLDREYNDSFLKLLTQTTWFERSDSEYDIKLKGKLDLPGTKRRFRLFIDSDPDEQNTIEERNRSISRGQRIRESRSVAGIEFSKRKPLTRWKTSFSLGGKLSGEFNLLGRARVRKHWILNENWSSYFHQDLWHLDGTGWGETSHSEFTRALGKRSWIQFLTELEYQDDNPSWEYIHSWRIDHVASDKHAFTYKIGVTGETLDGILEDNRFLSFSWRRKIYDDWAFLHLTPEVYFSSDDNYKAEAALTIKLEIFLTD